MTPTRSSPRSATAGAADGEFWGVWAAEPPQFGPGGAAGRRHRRLRRRRHRRFRWLLDGVKPWCSGVGRCTHALVTARVDGKPRLFAVDLRHPGVTGSADAWVNAGMAATATGEVAFDAVPAVTVGGPRDYLDRPGFWHGGVGVVACLLGGSRGFTTSWPAPRPATANLTPWPTSGRWMRRWRTPGG